MRGLTQRKLVVDIDGANKKLAWSAQVDLRNCGLGGINQAIERLDTGQWEPWFGDYIKLSGLDAADLDDAIVKFIAGLSAFLVDPGYGRLLLCLTTSGFLASPQPCQLAIMARLGQMYLAHYSYAIGHSTPVMVEVGGGASEEGLVVDPDLPYAASLTRLIAMGDAEAARLTQRPETNFDRLLMGLGAIRAYRFANTDVEVSDCGSSVAVCVTRDIPDIVLQRIEGFDWRVDKDASAHYYYCVFVV